jgi:hypothetical protein
MNTALTLMWLIACLMILCLIVLVVIALYLLFARRQGIFPYPPKRYPQREYLVQDELILAGPQAQLDALRDLGLGVSLRRLDRLEFRDFGNRLAGCPGLPHSMEPGRGLVIDRYRIEGLLSDVRRAIGRINDRLGEQSGEVVKDPNWLVGQPFEVEGSPFEVEGSPFEVEGSPSSPAVVAATAPAEDFPGQWAFEKLGLGAGSPPLGLKQHTGLPGWGVRVGIFDASPFTDPAAQVPPMPLHVHHPAPLAGRAAAPRQRIYLRNHGYYAAGLVLGVAPGAEVHLVRVLEDDNRGDLFTLIAAMFNFLKASALQDDLPQVLNLSLGVRIPPQEAEYGLPTEVRSLQYVINAARCLGAVIVAAAGNTSARKRVPEPPHLPAGFSAVVGVAAINAADERACFSNAGDLSAPGGDGRPAAAGDPPGCRPRSTASASIIGPVFDPPTDTGFLYWSGTSFAAPLVAGLAARLFSMPGVRLTPAQVERLLYCESRPVEDHHLGIGIAQAEEGRPEQKSD